MSAAAARPVGGSAVAREHVPGGAPRLLIISTVAVTLEGFLLPFARHFRSLGWRVDGMAAGVTASPGCRSAFDHVWEAGWARRLAAPGNVAALRRVRRVVREQRYDLVHVHTPVAAFLTRAALRPSRARRGAPRVVYTAHGFHFSDGAGGLGPAAYRWAERLAGRWTDRLVVINEEDERLALRHGIVDAARLEHMPGIGVDLEHYAADRVDDRAVARAREELGLRADDPLFALVAEFIPRKRHRDVVHALHRLNRLGYDRVHIACLGNGPLMAETQSLARRLGLAQRLHLLGARDDVRPFVRAARALLLVSDREGLPRSVLEAMSMGTPVIGSRIRGTADLLRDDRGFLVPVGDAERLAAAMIQVVDDPVEAGRRAAAARAYAPRFALPAIVERHERCYAQLLAGRPR